MERHLLVTVGESDPALCGVRFISSFFRSSNKIRLSLFQVDAGKTPAYDGYGREYALSCALSAEAREENSLLEEARQVLCGSGFSDQLMGVKVVFRQYARAVDVIIEGESGLYDAIVMGGDALKRLEEGFGNSNPVLKVRRGVPLWTCRMDDMPRSGVLLCVDGSRPSISIADHVGFMLRHEPHQRITLFHVVREGGEKARAKGWAAMEQGMAALLENGVEEARIDARMVPATDVARAILNEATQGEYAVVAMGRTGAGQGAYPRIFIGSCADSIYQHMRGASLWVCS